MSLGEGKTHVFVPIFLEEPAFCKHSTSLPLSVSFLKAGRFGDDSNRTSSWSPREKKTASTKPRATDLVMPFSPTCVESLIQWAQRNGSILSRNPLLSISNIYHHASVS